MKFLNKLIGGNVLLKVTSMNSLSVVIQIISGFAVSKVLALFVGPQGFKFIGDLRNLLGVIEQLGVIGMSNGVVKYVAELKDNSPELNKLLSTTYIITFIASIIVGAGVFFGASAINNLLFIEADYSNIIRFIAVVLPLYSFNIIIISVLNGYEFYKTYVTINIAFYLIALFVMVLMVWQFNLIGALYAIVILPIINGIITVAALTRLRKVKIFPSSLKINTSYAKRLGSYAIMRLVSAISLPIVMIAIRAEIVAIDGLAEAGYWEAINRISNYYMMFFTSLMTLYILPKLSKADTKTFRDEIFNFYKTLVPIFAIGMAIIFLLKVYIIKIVLTAEFMPMQYLFKWQLLGDLLKIMSVVIAYQFLAKNLFWQYITTEIVSIITIYFSSIYFIQEYGFVGASMGHLFSYCIYFIIVLAIFRKPLLLGKVD